MVVARRKLWFAQRNLGRMGFLRCVATNTTMARGHGFILTTPSLENVGSSTMLVSLDRLLLIKRSMEPLYAVGGVIYVNIMLLTRNMNPGH